MAFNEKNVCQKKKVPILNNLGNLADRTTCFALDLACLKTRLLCQKRCQRKKKNFAFDTQVCFCRGLKLPLGL